MTSVQQIILLVHNNNGDGRIVTRRRNCLWLFLVTTAALTLSLTISVVDCKVPGHHHHMGHGGDPEFADPVKNISSPYGSNIDLNCNVRNLGTNRIMWLKKETDRETLLAINALKITKNPRISVSLLQSSGDLSQSRLYIYNIEKEDEGTYHCIVNTSPMIIHVGTLEVKDEPETVQIQQPFDPKPTVSMPKTPEAETQRPAQQNKNESQNNGENNSDNKDKIDGPSGSGSSSSSSSSLDNVNIHDHDHHHQEEGQEGPSSDVFCIDLNKIWRETKYLFSVVVSFI